MAENSHETARRKCGGRPFPAGMSGNPGASRIRLFLALPLDDIDSMSIQQQLGAMGGEGPT